MNICDVNFLDRKNIASTEEKHPHLPDKEIKGLIFEILNLQTYSSIDGIDGVLCNLPLRGRSSCLQLLKVLDQRLLLTPRREATKDFLEVQRALIQVNAMAANKKCISWLR